MDIFDEEILKFWAALQKCRVKYIMLGGYAANLHGYQRYTGDMDNLDRGLVRKKILGESNS